MKYPFQSKHSNSEFFFPDPTVLTSSEKNVELNQKDCGRV